MPAFEFSVAEVDVIFFGLSFVCGVCLAEGRGSKWIKPPFSPSAVLLLSIFELQYVEQ